MEKFRITLDRVQQLVKPFGDAAVKPIMNRLNKNEEVSIEEIASCVVQPNSFTWCPATYNGRRKNENWVSQQVFALDFDKNPSPEDILEVCRIYGLICNVMHTSFSDKPEYRKLRAVFFLDKVIEDAKTAKFIQLNLMKLFEKDGITPDKQCSDYARVFFGGKEILHLNPKTNSFSKLLILLNTVQFGRDGNRPRGMVYFGETPEDSIDIIGTSGNLPKTIKSGLVNENTERVKAGYVIVEKFDFDKLKERCFDFNEFTNLKRVCYMQIWGFATNLKWIEGGEKILIETMNEYNRNNTKDLYRQCDFNVVKSARVQDLPRQFVSEFTTQEYELDIHQDFVSLVKHKMGEITNTNPFLQKIPMSKAETMLKDGIKAFFEAEEGVFLIKCPTGLGKTELLLSVEGVTIAVETHRLKDEFIKRRRETYTTEFDIDFSSFKMDSIIISPEAPKFETEAITNYVERLRFAGLHTAVSSYYNDIAKGKVAIATQNDIDAAVEYTTAHRAYMQAPANATIITTHASLLISNKTYDTLIVDEDIISKMLAIKSVKISDIQKFVNKLEENVKIKKSVENVITFLSSQSCGAFQKMTVIEVDMKSLQKELLRLATDDDKLFISGAVLEFLSSALLFQRDSSDGDTINFLTQKSLPKYKKLLILTATPSLTQYNALFPGLNLLLIENVEQVGKIKQSAKRSFSRVGFYKNPQLVKDLAISIGDLPVITHKSEISNFKNTIEGLYFNNCAGVDFLKGKDIVVVGTPHKPAFVYMLTAMALGIELTMKDNQISNKYIERGNKGFMFPSFDNPVLQALQCDMIEAELVQAAGRSRTSRTAATVYVFSSFPHPDCEEFVETIAF